MDWRSAHPWIVITNGAEIRLSDNPLAIRHLHIRDLRVAHRKDRVAFHNQANGEGENVSTQWRSVVSQRLVVAVIIHVWYQCSTRLLSTTTAAPSPRCSISRSTRSAQASNTAFSSQTASEHSATSRIQVRRCIPFGLGGKGLPHSHPSRARRLLVLHIARVKASA